MLVTHRPLGGARELTPTSTPATQPMANRRRWANSSRRRLFFSLSEAPSRTEPSAVIWSFGSSLLASFPSLSPCTSLRYTIKEMLAWKSCLRVESRECELCSLKKITSAKVKVKSLGRVRLFATPWTVAYQAPPSMGFSRQECWSGLPFPSPEDLPDPGIEPGSPVLQADTLPSEPPGKPMVVVI